MQDYSVLGLGGVGAAYAFGKLPQSNEIAEMLPIKYQKGVFCSSCAKLSNFWVLDTTQYELGNLLDLVVVASYLASTSRPQHGTLQNPKTAALGSDRLRIGSLSEKCNVWGLRV